MEALDFGNFLPEEIQCFAEDNLVTVVPKFSLPTADSNVVFCLTSKYGPFQPNTPVKVPLWLAIALQKKKRCTIQPPEWLQEEKLQEVLDHERELSDGFQNLPYHYVEIASLLLRQTLERSSDLYKVKELKETIRKVRSSKINAGLKGINSAVSVKINHLSAMECNVIRLLLEGALDRMDWLEKVARRDSEVAAVEQPTAEQAVRQLRR